MKHQLQTIRHHLEPLANNSGVRKALTALSELERMAGEPVYWQWRRKGHDWTLEYTFANEVQVTTKDSERRALYAAPPTQHQGDVVVSWDEQRTRIVGVTRQDEDGRILKVIAEAPAQQPQADSIPVAAFDRLMALCDSQAQRIIELEDKQPQAEAVEYTKKDWIDAAVRVYRVAGDTEDVALDCAKSLAREQDWASAHDDLSDPYEAALEDVEGRREAPQQAEAVHCTRADLDRAYSAGLVEGERLAIQQAEAVPTGTLIDPGTVVSFAVDRWLAEVANRPMVNKNRRALDDTWRQVIRHFGGDPNALIGPDHDTLIAAAQGEKP